MADIRDYIHSYCVWSLSRREIESEDDWSRSQKGAAAEHAVAEWAGLEQWVCACIYMQARSNLARYIIIVKCSGMTGHIHMCLWLLLT